MFPAAFDYRAARSIEDALSALGQYGADARILAGGQSLIPAMRYRLARPAALIDINPIPALDYISESDGHLLIGAGARDYALETSAAIAERYPLIADTSAVVADPVVRQMGTVIGSLCHNDPAGDWPVAALAARAEVVVRGPKISRVVAIDEFIVDSFATALGEGEMAVEVRFPAYLPRSSGAFFKLERKVGDFATASAAVQITLADDGAIADAGVAIGAVGPKALRVAQAELLLCGAKPSGELIAAAVDAAKRAADPVADTRGSVEFKREMAGVLVGRALHRTFNRLKVGGLQS